MLTKWTFSTVVEGKVIVLGLAEMLFGCKRVISLGWSTFIPLLVTLLNRVKAVKETLITGFQMVMTIHPSIHCCSLYYVHQLT